MLTALIFSLSPLGRRSLLSPLPSGERVRVRGSSLSGGLQNFLR